MDINLVEILKDNGVVGAGGAGFPTHVKVNAKVEHVLVNGAECEPLLRVDQQLMAQNAREMLSGLKLVMERVESKKGIVCLKGKYKEAIKVLKNLTKDEPNISIFEMGNFYPAGDEQIMVYEATKKVVPEGGMPLNVSVVVTNVETLININNAVNKNEPVVDTYVTVTGEVNNPITVKAPIGLTVRELIDLAGGTPLEDYYVIDGGPMMGKVIKDMDTPITKTTKGLIVLSKEHSLIGTQEKSVTNMLKDAKTACMNCSLCSEVCPRNLLGHNLKPHKLMRLASYNSTCDTSVSATTAFLCCECRLCQYACVMDLQPWKLHSSLKKQLSSHGVRYSTDKNQSPVNEFREYKKYPVKKLVNQLELGKYDVAAPMVDFNYQPKVVKILLKQHIGAPTTPIVKVGDYVKRNDTISKIEDGKLGADIHSSINGKVIEVTANYILVKSSPEEGLENA